MNNKKTDSIFNLLAFIPITGVFGFHDLYIKDYKRFIFHVVMSAIATALNIAVPKAVADYLFSISTKGYIMMPSDPVYTFFCSALPTLIFIGLYICGIVENRRYVKTQTSSETPSPQVLSPEAPQVQATTEQANSDNKIDNRKFATISFFLSLIPIAVWSYTLITIIQNLDRIRAPGYSGGMATVWLPLFYYETLGIGFVISFFSIIFAIKGLKIKEQKPIAIVSLVLKVVTMVLIIMTFAAPRILP